MRILITAGNTQTPIDRVRCITNIFTGRTGGQIAVEAHRRGHAVHLLTSHPEAVEPPDNHESHWTVQTYRTFADLEAAMAALIPNGRFDAVVHCAAVSDFRVTGIYSPMPGTRFDAPSGSWIAAEGRPRMADIAQGKVKSTHAEVWMRLEPTPKLVDKIRREWQFAGILVKFKLEVGAGDEELINIAEDARRQSDADLLLANTLEGMAQWAYLGPISGGYEKVPRRELAVRLVQAVEEKQMENG
jgi:phosphopantothenate-cysteine ligase/phosphopantothenoylcysteine decarboxylase/phosphopantothenate--cysteine ligase